MAEQKLLLIEVNLAFILVYFFTIITVGFANCWTLVDRESSFFLCLWLHANLHSLQLLDTLQLFGQYLYVLHELTERNTYN